MERTPSGPIRKIQYGIIPNLPMLIVQVGSSVLRDYVIVDIVEDRNMFLEVGHFEYLVYIQKKDGPRFFWKRFLKTPDLVEYASDGENIILL